MYKISTELEEMASDIIETAMPRLSGCTICYISMFEEGRE